MFIPAIALTLATISPASAPLAMAQQTSIQATESESVCPVTGKLIPTGQGLKTIVRGHDYLVIDVEAAKELKTNPDKYLQADGTPKNLNKKQ